MFITSTEKKLILNNTEQGHIWKKIPRNNHIPSFKRYSVCFFMGVIKKYLGFVENILSTKSILTMSLCLYKRFVKNSKVLFTASK